MTTVGTAVDEGDAEPTDEGSAAPVRVPSRLDPTVWRATRALGGPWGRHAAVARWTWWTPLRWLMVMTLVTLLLGYAQKSPCADGNWTGNKQYTHFCYSDIVPLWGDEKLDVGAVPYRDATVEYPVLTGAFMWFTADLTRGIHRLESSWPDLIVFGVLTALLLSLCALVVTAGTAGTARGRPYDAAIWALSPLLIFHAFSNWDLLAMAFTAAAMWAWAKEKPVLSGAMIGLGTAAKLYPVFLLVAVWTLAIRTRRWSEAAWATGTAALVWLAANVPIGLAYHRGWWEFYKFSMDRATERSTVWAIAKTLFAGSSGNNDAVYWVPPGWAVALALVGALLFVVVLGLGAPVRPRLAQLAFLAVLAFLLTTKVWSPQYSLWLVPLVALARPRWRLTVIWQFVEILVWLATLTVLLNYNDSVHGISYGWLELILLTRDALLVAIAALVVREMWNPELDVVRVNGADDPSGGVFEGADDYWNRLVVESPEPGADAPRDAAFDQEPDPALDDEPGAALDGQTEARR